jgi:glutamate synthase (NADPH/NADH) small chain
MVNHTGFMKYERLDPPKRAVKKRIKDFKEFEELLPVESLTQQAARCMYCGVPSCHSFGCPLQNRIPDWNDMVHRGHWKRALELLHRTNNFPEITGRICPAPCEAACTLSINQSAVLIRHIELQIIEEGWQKGWIQPEPSQYKTGKRVAIVGSGPAGLAAAQQLARYGHEVVVFEKMDRIGGILRYGIPDFKMEKWIIDRRLEHLRKERVTFETSVDAGIDISARYMKRSFDAMVIATGAVVPRSLDIPGSNLQSIHFAMDFLIQQNRRLAGDALRPEEQITVKDKNVVVIGGGDTGSDCVGTARRLGADKIVQIEILPKPPLERSLNNPWPTWPNILRSSSSHQEGCKRLWSILVQKFVGDNNKVKQLECVKLEWYQSDKTGKAEFRQIPGSEFSIQADLVLLATGFLHVEHGPLLKNLNIKINHQGNIIVDTNQMTSTPGVFAAGDSVLGASLVVKAIAQGRKTAEGVQRYLTTP